MFVNNPRCLRIYKTPSLGFRHIEFVHVYPMTPSLGKSSLLQTLGYRNPNVWRKLGFPTLASPIRHLGSLQGKLGFLTLTSYIC